MTRPINAGVNTGAGTVTSTCAGKTKPPTSIEDRFFAGSNTSLAVRVLQTSYANYHPISRGKRGANQQTQ